MYGDIGHKLILDAKRSQALNSITQYQDEMIRSIVRETRDLQKDADQLTEMMAAEEEETEGARDSESDKVKQCQLFVTHLCMRRNKRCLLSYGKQRAELLDQLVWKNVDISSNMASKLSFHEQEYFRKYNELVSEFKGTMDDVDLSGSLEPPCDVFIDVRVLKDAGEIQTEYGIFNLTRDSQFFVRQADVERLIQQGYLKKL